MNDNTTVDFLMGAITERANALNARASANRQRGFQLKMLVTSLSALTTVLLGLKGFNSPWGVGIQNVALLSSALVSMFAAWDAFFNYRANWLSQQAAVGQLKELEKDVKFALAVGGDGIEQVKLTELYGRYRQIMSDYNSSWLQLKRATESQSQIG
jgi:hypothetical protein